MNWVDGVILLAFALALLSGYHRGVVMQVFSWGGFILGIIAGALLGPPIVRAISPHSVNARRIAVLASFLGIAFIVEALIAFAGSRVARKITHAKLKRADQIIGAVVAALLLLLAAWMLSLPARAVSGLEASIKKSAILRGEYAVLSKPPDFLASILSLLSHTGFPEVFTELNPNLAPGVQAPPASLANNMAILAAAQLTFKIEGDGCEGRVDGSGFPVEPHLVITAAHVVAGTKNTEVIQPNGDRFRATVVYWDPNADIAVLRVGSLPSGDLRVDAEIASRNTDGAAIGYPGGGKRTISVARVRGHTDATGYDIYSQHAVDRLIYVLRASVIPGNSGGPFVDTNGQVRGMIFAAATDSKTTAYALDGQEIDKAIRGATGKTRQVDTKTCAIE
ncbi:MAG TPA: MarP family serine protease [Actinomycetota bacterium]|nr:MarP family serine protease [Actinomycetota bacterium]